MISVLEKWNSLDADDLTKREYETIKDFAEGYYGYSAIADENEDDYRYGYYYNPNAKWDWYSEGGRWRGFIKRRAIRRAFVSKESRKTLFTYFFLSFFSVTSVVLVSY